MIKVLQRDLLDIMFDSIQNMENSFLNLFTTPIQFQNSKRGVHIHEQYDPSVHVCSCQMQS